MLKPAGQKPIPTTFAHQLAPAPDSGSYTQIQCSCSLMEVLRASSLVPSCCWYVRSSSFKAHFADACWLSTLKPHFFNNSHVALQPGVTSANVGQLAIDLIISTLHLPCVGQLETSCLLPCAGIGAFDHLSQRVSLSLELFECPVAQGAPVFVLQQRAPAARGCQQKYAEELARWISEAAFAEVSCFDS